MSAIRLNSRVKYLTLCFFCLIIGCEEKPFKVNFARPELTVNGVLIADESPRISIGRTWSPTGQIPGVPYVEDAEAELFNRGKSVGKFNYVSDRIYLLQAYRIIAGETYIVKVKGLNTEAQSLPVKVPLAFPLNGMYLDKNTEVSSVNSYANPRLVNISIRDYIETGNYYGLTVTPYAQGYRLSGNVTNVEISNSSLDYREDDCFQKAPLWTGLYRAPNSPALESSMIIYNDLCFADRDKNFGIVVEMTGTAQAPTPFNTDAEELRIQMAVLSAEYFEFAKTFAKTEGIENAFVEVGQTHERLKLCSKVYLCCHDRDDEIFFRNTRLQGSAQV